MMGAAHRVKSGFLQLTAPAVLSVRESRRADDPVIVMDTGSPQFNLFSVKPQTLLCIKAQRAKPDRLAALRSASFSPS